MDSLPLLQQELGQRLDRRSAPGEGAGEQRLDVLLAQWLEAQGDDGQRLPELIDTLVERVQGVDLVVAIAADEEQLPRADQHGADDWVAPSKTSCPLRRR